MRVRWTEEASEDLDQLLSFIASKDTYAAGLVAERVLRTERHIETFPRAARYDTETDTYDRFVPKTRIILSYEIARSAIWIIRVWHTSRDPETKPRR